MTPEAFRDALARSGITPEKPLYPVLLTVWEAAKPPERRQRTGQGV